MKRGGSAAVALLGSLLGCTAPEPSFQEDLEVGDPGMAALGEPANPGARRPLQPPPEVEPTPQVEPMPATDPPRIEVSIERPDSDEEDEYEDEYEYEYGASCPVWITATGFPAISADGTKIVQDEFVVGDASTDDMEGVRTIRWLDTKTGSGVQAETPSSSRAASSSCPPSQPCSTLSSATLPPLACLG